MAETLTSLLKPAMEELGRITVAVIKRQFNYLCCLKSNSQSLKEEAKKLEDARGGLQIQVEAAENKGEVVVPEVKTWLENASKIEVDNRGIDDEIATVKTGCLSIKSRFLLSRKVKETTDAMKDLRERCNDLKKISESAPPASKAAIPQGTSCEFESRKQIENEIMEDLRGRKVNMMGICGMGGVGKTTMAERIMERVSEEKLFDEVVMVVVSQPIDQRKIQGDIAEFLGLKLKDDSLPARAYELRARIMGGKCILLILDDVWEGLNLKELGIPYKIDVGGGCTIVLTSRNKEVLNKMDAKPYEVPFLFEEEAWFLFRDKVGTWVELSDLRSTAEDVAKECKGLPLALTVVGTTLKNEKGKRVWEDALRQLKIANPEAMPDVLKDVYNPLKLSYLSLENQQAESLFLLCCIFPEDHNIHLEYLTLFGIGLRMFEGMSVEEARNRVRTLLKMLKGRFLLLDGHDENHVKMHDVVRDVATFIASEEGRVDRKLSLKHCSREESINCTWISVIGEQINKLPIDLSFPSLRLFLIDSLIEICEPFRGKEELNVLYFGGISFRSLPETTKLLKNLRTLYLNWCSSLETISIVGELSSLEILICRNCSRIMELPAEIGKLDRLKLLHFSKCQNLKRIAPGVISKLVQLEELIIVQSFTRWERKENGEQRDNAALCELEQLENLIRLEIDIEDVSLVAEEICFSTKIVNCQIRFISGRMRWLDFFHHESGMALVLGKDITLAKWIHVFLRSSHSLFATGDGSNNLDLAQVQNLKRLICSDCSTMNKLVNITSSMDRSFDVFRFLEYLKLCKLPNLEEICKLPKASNSFMNLKDLEVDSCAMMEEVFANEENEKDGDQCHMITFPELKSLMLSNLPRLTTFCKGSKSIKFPLLNTISIQGCGNLRSLISGSCSNLNLEGHDVDSFHLFCNQKVSFDSLKNIEIRGYPNIRKIWCHQIPPCFFTQLEELEIANCNGPARSLFSSSIAKNLVNLQRLKVGSCKEMVKVIEDDEEMLGDQNSHLQFPKLKELRIKSLPKLQSFYNRRCDLQLPLLERVAISFCGLLEFFTMEFVIFGNLKEISIVGCDGINSLFSSLIAKKLDNLTSLLIVGCNEMEKVIKDDEEMLAADQNPPLLFPNLLKLELGNLSKLQSFCNWRCDFQLPSLESVFINECALLEFFTIGSVSTQNLKSLSINYQLKDVGDLNGAIKLQFSRTLVETTYFDIQAGEEENHQKSKIQDAEQINEVSTSAEVKVVEADHGKSEIKEEEINEESTSAEVKVVEAHQVKAK